jgi:NADPH:quinone reductase
MQAAFLEATGGPDVLHYGELPTPAPQAGEVLVRVGAAALNPIDVYIRAGTVKMPLPIPFITGTDVAGTVAAVGSGVRDFKK